MFQLNMKMENINERIFYNNSLFHASMPSLQLGVDVVLIFVVVSPLDGDERLISVSQFSTEVNICVCTTRDSSLLPRCRVQTTTLPPPGWMSEVLVEIILN